MNAADLIAIEIRGRSAAPVELDDGALGVVQLAVHRDLTFELIEIRIRDGAALRTDDHVAGAERAVLFAKGKMEVDRKRDAAPVLLDALEMSREFLRPHRIVPDRRRRVGGIARTDKIVSIEERPIQIPQSFGFIDMCHGV